MSERDTDFEFDFFDDPETREGPATDRIPRVGPRRPGGPGVSTQGLLRLVVLVAAVILLVVLLVIGISSCSGSGTRGTYERFMKSVRGVGAQSDAIGKQLSTLLTTPGIKTAELDPKLSGLAQQQLQGIQAAQQIRAPASLRLEQQHVVES